MAGVLGVLGERMGREEVPGERRGREGECRVGVLGSAGVGKASLVTAFTRGEFILVSCTWPGPCGDMRPGMFHECWRVNHRVKYVRCIMKLCHKLPACLVQKMSEMFIVCAVQWAVLNMEYLGLCDSHHSDLCRCDAAPTPPVSSPLQSCVCSLCHMVGLTWRL